MKSLPEPVYSFHRSCFTLKCEAQKVQQLHQSLGVCLGAECALFAGEENVVDEAVVRAGDAVDAFEFGRMRKVIGREASLAPGVDAAADDVVEVSAALGPVPK